VPSQSYMWFNATSPCELGQYCGGIYKLLCVCTGRTVTRTHTQQLIYATTILTESTWTCTIEPHVTLARHRCSPPEDDSFVFRNMSGFFICDFICIFNAFLASINFVQ
jgi:hypothetical protein